jgi:hypothetical protein
VARDLPVWLVEGRHQAEGRRTRHKDQGSGKAGRLAALGVDPDRLRRGVGMNEVQLDLGFGCSPFVSLVDFLAAYPTWAERCRDRGWFTSTLEKLP